MKPLGLVLRGFSPYPGTQGADVERVVGVIRPVEERKRRIPTRVLVVPETRGSRIEVRENA